MAYLKINWSINATGTEELDLEDLGYTLEEWNDLSKEEQEAYILETLEYEELVATPVVNEWSVVTDED